MEYIANCSFGKDSLATIIVARRYKETLDSVLYCETMFSEEISGEIPEHRDFIYQTAIPILESWGIPVTVVRPQKTYLDCFYHKITDRSRFIGLYKGFPLTGRCYIQDRCKAAALDRHRKKIMEHRSYVGISCDEILRLSRLKHNQISLLDKYNITGSKAVEICKEEGLLSPVYEFTKRGGCWFCPNAGEQELYHLWTYHPELWDWLIYLGNETNVPTQLFNRKYTIQELDKKFSVWNHIKNCK